MDKIKLIREEALSWIPDLDFSSRYFETFESKEQLIKEIEEDEYTCMWMFFEVIENHLYPNPYRIETFEDVLIYKVKDTYLKMDRGDDYRYIVTIVKPVIKTYLSYE